MLFFHCLSKNYKSTIELAFKYFVENIQNAIYFYCLEFCFIMDEIYF